MMLGFSKKRLQTLYDPMVEFSGLGHFIDQPLKKFSSGMRSRLAFSIMAMLEPEIMVLDEALSAGDLEFSQKAGQKIQDLIERTRAVIVVTHNLGFATNFCTHVIWLDRGRVKAQGDPQTITKAYSEYAQSKAKRQRKRCLESHPQSN